MMGGLSGEDDMFIEAMILTGSSQDLTLSCLPVTKSLDAPIFTVRPVVTDDRDKDPEDEG